MNSCSPLLSRGSTSASHTMTDPELSGFTANMPAELFTGRGTFRCLYRYERAAAEYSLISSKIWPSLQMRFVPSTLQTVTPGIHLCTPSRSPTIAQAFSGVTATRIVLISFATVSPSPLILGFAEYQLDVALEVPHTLGENRRILLGLREDKRSFVDCQKVPGQTLRINATAR